MILGMNVRVVEGFPEDAIALVAPGAFAIETIRFEGNAIIAEGGADMRKIAVITGLATAELREEKA